MPISSVIAFLIVKLCCIDNSCYCFLGTTHYFVNTYVISDMVMEHIDENNEMSFPHTIYQNEDTSFQGICKNAFKLCFIMVKAFLIAKIFCIDTNLILVIDISVPLVTL